MSPIDYDNLGYEVFKKLAQDPTIDQYERVGFPASYRKGKTDFIFNDILSKLTNLNSKKIRFLDIGPGWSELTTKILEFCENSNHEVIFIDSQEMLDLIPPYRGLIKIPGKFPDEIKDITSLGKFDVILTYSVIQYVFSESNIFNFMDSAASMLNREGQFLVGDIPNISMKKRFLDSETAKIYHKMNYGETNDPFPNFSFNTMEKNHIDDGVLMGLMGRLRMSGFHTFLLPQDVNLPMSNRREDLLVIRP